MDSTQIRKFVASFFIFSVGVTIISADWQWTQYVKPGNSGANDTFGISVDISGTLVVVGAPAESGGGTGTGGTGTDDGVMQAGAAYIYTISDSGELDNEVYIKPSSVNIFGNFGQSVSTDGKRVYIGAPGQYNTGAVFVFEMIDDEWVETAILKPEKQKAGDFFGYSISSSMGRVIVGAPGDDTGLSESDSEVPSSGAAYIFEMTPEGWVESARIKAQKPEILGGFGLSVDISGTTAIVGSPGENSVFEWEETEIYPPSENGILDAGAVYIYRKSGNGWNLNSRLTGDQSFPEGRFGESVRISGSTALIGAPGETLQLTDVDGNVLPYMSTGAVYVYSRIGDGWIRQDILTARNGQGGDLFGNSISHFGNRILIGAPGEDSGIRTNMADNSMRNAGAAYLYEKIENRWELKDYFKADHVSKDDGLGEWVTMNGNYVVLGASKEDGRRPATLLPDTDDNSNLNSGVIYVLKNESGVSGAEWDGVLVTGNNVVIEDDSQTVSLESGTDFGKIFTGSSVSRKFNILNTGQAAMWIDSIATSSEEFGILTEEELPFSLEPGGVMDLEISIKSGDAPGLVSSQVEISVSGNPIDSYEFLVMGFRERFSSIGNVFTNTGSGGRDDMFGRSLSASDGVIASGAFRNDSEAGQDAGVVYIYEKYEEAQWSLAQSLFSPDPGPEEYFGYAVSVMSNDLPSESLEVGSGVRHLAVGAPGRPLESGAGDNNIRAGAVYLFNHGDSGWEFLQRIVSNNLDIGDAFGSSVYLDGNQLIVGAPDENGGGIAVDDSEQDNSRENAGAAYIFAESDEGQWTQTAYLKASNSDDYDGFGWSVAISGSIAVVGAPYESSSANTVNGSELNNIFFAAGAAYIFEKNDEGQWAQQAYLKPSNPGSEDFFGWSVAIDGQTVAIGAPGEDSAAQQLTPGTPDNSMSDSGAVYIFEKQPDGWKQTAFLKGSARHTTYGFGRQVSMNGGRLATGAIHDHNATPGINPGQVSNGSPDSGAFYIFELQGHTGEWDEIFYVKSSRPVTSEEFGFSTALTEKHVVVSSLSKLDDGKRDGELAIYSLESMKESDAQNQPELWISTQGLSLHGDYNQDYEIEMSRDLNDWGQRMNVTGTGWGFPVHIPWPAPSGVGVEPESVFFRLANEALDPR